MFSKYCIYVDKVGAWLVGVQKDHKYADVI